jgi:hypothetical protein
MVTRDSRRVENEKMARYGNERLHDAVEDVVPDAKPVPFLCECAAEFCHARVELTLEQWEEIAAEPSHFVMVAGHERSEGEQIIGKLGEYDVVEKPI